MAKTVKKSYGQADMGLVAAAGAYAKSLVPNDNSKFYAAQVLANRGMLQNIKGVIDVAYAENKALDESLTNFSQSIIDQMDTEGGLFNEHLAEMHQQTVLDYRERLEKIDPFTKEGKLLRQKLEVEIRKYSSTMSQNQEYMKNIVLNSANGDILSDFNSDEKLLFTQIAEDVKNNTNKTNATYKDGDVYYTLYDVNGQPKLDGNNEPITMSMSSIRKGFSVNDKGYAADVVKNVLVPFGQQAKNLDRAMNQEDLDRVKKSLNSRIVNDDQVRILANNNFQQDYSFHEILNLQGDMYEEYEEDGVKKQRLAIDPSALEAVLMSMEEAGIDMDGDGRPDIQKNEDGSFTVDDLDGQDFKKHNFDVNSGDNIYYLTQVLKKIQDPANKALYKDIMVNYIGNTAAKDFYQQGFEQSESFKIGKYSYGPDGNKTTNN
jgi:hypothetical protein